MEPTKNQDPEGTEITRRVPQKLSEAPPEIPGYQILEKIGEGGMGAVYKARQLRLERTVAIKVLHPGPDGQNPIRNFQAESRLMAALSDPHIVAIHDCGELDGLYYLVMEYVGGPNLRSLMKPGQPWPVARAAKVLDIIARAVTRIHEERVLHLDLKPENILCTPDGNFKISDFGIARGPEDSKKVVELGYVHGTLNYAAPEQRFGLPTDERSDLYALAVLAYELLTGELPSVSHDAPSGLNPKVPVEVDEVLRRALARHPEQRFSSVEEFRRALMAALAIRRGMQRWVAALAFAGSLLALGAILLVVFGKERPQPQPPPPRPPAVTIVNKDGVRRFEATDYQGVVESDGCLTSLRIGGVEFLQMGGLVTRGSYFFDQQSNEALTLTDVTQPSDRSILARGDRASVLYEFEPGAINLTLKNESNRTLAFFFIFDLGVTAVGQDETRLSNLPQLRVWPNTVWYAGKSKLKITGGNAIWGMWHGVYQVWQASLESQESRRIQLTPGSTTAEEQDQLKVLAGKVIQTSKYTARIEADGCLTSFRIAGSEFLRADFGFSRGGYLFQDALLTLPKVERADPRGVTVRSDRAVVRYDGEEDSFLCTVTNLTDQSQFFFLVFHPNVNAVVNDKGEWSKTPALKDWGNTSWFAGKARLKVTGATKIWGPWEHRSQVCEMVVPPRQTKQMVMQAGLTSPQEAAAVAKVTAP